MENPHYNVDVGAKAIIGNLKDQGQTDWDEGELDAPFIVAFGKGAGDATEKHEHPREEKLENPKVAIVNRHEDVRKKGEDTFHLGRIRLLVGQSDHSARSDVKKCTASMEQDHQKNREAPKEIDLENPLLMVALAFEGGQGNALGLFHNVFILFFLPY